MGIALCIPAYNAEWCLPRLLQSAQEQTKPFQEIWVYDDCSTDNTSDIATRFGAKVIRGEENRGCSHGKNKLAAAVATDWIHFHDADDLLLPKFIELAEYWIQNNDADVVLFNYDVIDEITHKKLHCRVFDPVQCQEDPKRYAIREQINPFCGLYKTQEFLAAGGYDEDPAVLYNEDVAFHMRLAFAGLRFAVEPEVAIINYMQANSMSQSNRLKCLQAHLAVLRKTSAHPGAGPYRRDLASKLWGAIAGLEAELDWASVDQAIDLANQLAPVQAVPMNRFLQMACRLNPHQAIRLRELAIRLFKPQLRIGYPSLDKPIALSALKLLLKLNPYPKPRDA